MKACIACAEEIQDAAKLCRFCKTRQDEPSFSKSAEDLDVERANLDALIAKETPPTGATNSNSGGSGMFYGLGVMSIVAWLVFMNSRPNGYNWLLLTEGPCMPGPGPLRYQTIDCKFGSEQFWPVFYPTLALLCLAAIMFIVALRRSPK